MFTRLQCYISYQFTYLYPSNVLFSECVRMEIKLQTETNGKNWKRHLRPLECFRNRHFQLVKPEGIDKTSSYLANQFPFSDKIYKTQNFQPRNNQFELTSKKIVFQMRRKKGRNLIEAETLLFDRLKLVHSLKGSRKCKIR